MRSRPGMSVETWRHLDNLRVGEHNPPRILVMHIYDGTHVCIEISIHTKPTRHDPPHLLREIFQQKLFFPQFQPTLPPPEKQKSPAAPRPLGGIPRDFTLPESYAGASKNSEATD